MITDSLLVDLERFDLGKWRFIYESEAASMNNLHWFVGFLQILDLLLRQGYVNSSYVLY